MLKNIMAIVMRKQNRPLDILDDAEIEYIKRIINRGGKHGGVTVDR